MGRICLGREGPRTHGSIAQVRCGLGHTYGSPVGRHGHVFHGFERRHFSSPQAPHFVDANPDAPLDLSLLSDDDDLSGAEPPERVLFYVSFRHPRHASVDNANIHGAGSIRAELAQRRLTLGELRGGPRSISREALPFSR